MWQRLEAAHAAGRHRLVHARDGRGRRTELVAAMHQCQAGRPGEELERPIECRITTAKYDEMPAGELGGITYPVLDDTALEGFRTFDADAAWLKGAKSRSDHHGAGIEAHAAR